MVAVANKKVGIIGAGNMGKAIIKGLTDSGQVPAKDIFLSSRTQKRLDKITEQFGINKVSGNDELVDLVDIVILCVKPQDLAEALEPCRHTFTSSHVVISLAAGIEISDLRKLVSEAPLCRIMMNTPVFIREGLIAYCCEQSIGESLIEDMFSSMGQVVRLEEGDPFEAFTVASSSGTGFIFELMSYWQEWIEEHGINPDIAKQIVTQTFLGTSKLASTSSEKIDDLQNRVVSKKGVTAVGLESMRSLEVEGLMRMSFNKAIVRSKELARQNK